MESIRLIDPGFSTADAESPEIHLVNDSVTIRFKDWQEKKIEIFFSDTIAVKWQVAESTHENERDDSCYEIINSKWLASHITQSEVSKSEGHKHYKFNFNACGQLEVLAVDFTVL